MSLSKLFKLPNEVLSHVLANPAIPLCRRLNLRLLSNRCCDIIEDALKIKSALVIRTKDAAYANSKPADLVIKRGLSYKLIRILVRLFPEPTELTFALGSSLFPSASWSRVPFLFTQLNTSNLKAVKLYGQLTGDNDGKHIADALIPLPELTSLTLGGISLTVHILPQLGPVLSRLETFACPDIKADSSLLSSSLSPRCTNLMLHQNVFLSFSGPFLVQLSASLTHLHLDGYGPNRNTFWQSISGMHQLTSLTLNFESFYLDSFVFSRLAPLTRLTHVTFYNLMYGSAVALPAKRQTPSPGIKRLTLGFFCFSDVSQFDCQLFCETLSVWFPSLLHFTLVLTRQDDIPAIRHNLGKFPFSVEIVSQ